MALGTSYLNTEGCQSYYGTAAGAEFGRRNDFPFAALLPFPQYGPINETSSDQNHALYDSVFIKFQKRLGQGLNFLTPYVVEE